MSWHRKHLLDIESLTAEELTAVLDTARAFKAVGERDIKKVPALQGKTVVNFFVEPSTRTRVSFELSAKRLSADIINFAADASSFGPHPQFFTAGSSLPAPQKLTHVPGACWRGCAHAGSASCADVLAAAAGGWAATVTPDAARELWDWTAATVDDALEAADAEAAAEEAAAAASE